MSYEDSLHSALHLIKTRSGPQLPWDKGIFAQIFILPLFGINKRLRLTAPQSLLAAPSASHSQAPEVDQPDGARPLAPLPNFRSLLLPTSSLALEKIEGRRHTAIARFFFLLGSSPACGLNSSSSDIWTLHQSFVDCLAPKATGTRQALLDLQKYNEWCKSNSMQFIPFLEDHVYSYLRHLAKNSSASAPLSAVQAISFAIHVLDFPSSKIKGLCHGCLKHHHPHGGSWSSRPCVLQLMATMIVLWWVNCWFACMLVLDGEIFSKRILWSLTLRITHASLSSLPGISRPPTPWQKAVVSSPSQPSFSTSVSSNGGSATLRLELLLILALVGLCRIPLCLSWTTTDQPRKPWGPNLSLLFCEHTWTTRTFGRIVLSTPSSPLQPKLV